jgi:hypothetical protein
MGSIMMDWNIFWSAFGAIGTTAGSLITAAAVVVSVIQYRQPLLKKLKITFSCSLIGSEQGPKLHYVIGVGNRGIRECSIKSLIIKGKTQDLYLNFTQIKGDGHVKFPFLLKQEDWKDIIFDYELFRSVIKKQLENGWVPKERKLIIYVRDSVGDEHRGKSKIKMSAFL